MMLSGLSRGNFGKKSAKAFRKEGYLLANLYGKGIENKHLIFGYNDFFKAIKRKSSLVSNIKIDNKETMAVVIQEYQRDPITNRVLHVDLRVVVKGFKTKYLIPVKTKGTPKGIKDKGVFIVCKSRVVVKCEAKYIPDSICLDVSDLGVGDFILVRDIKDVKNVQILENDISQIVGVLRAK